MRKEFVIHNSKGLHARPATKLVQIANTFPCNLTIEYKGKKTDLKSIMSVLSLRIQAGDIITIIVDGENEQDCLKRLEQIINDININEG
jgi:phosphocarrier protein